MTDNNTTGQWLTFEPQPKWTSPRGFDYTAPIQSTYGGEVSASESSSAEGPHIWLWATNPAKLNHPNGPQPKQETAIHLTAENAWRLAEQLMTLVRDHYQGDARPEHRIADLTTNQ